MISSVGPSDGGLGAFSAPTLQTFPEGVTRNVAIVRSRTGSRIMAVVKADGYGHGAITVARAAIAAGAQWLVGLFDTATKYNGSARFTVPADLSRTDRAALTQAALRMFDALGFAGVARMDFFLTDDGPVLNEVNTMPGMTAESQVPRMFAATGVQFEDLIARMIDAAMSIDSEKSAVS